MCCGIYVSIYDVLEKIRAVHLTESYGGQGMKYLKVPKLKYLMVQKYKTKYKKMGPNTNLI